MAKSSKQITNKQITNKQITKTTCKHCGSTKTFKYGRSSSWKAGKRVQKQRYMCNNCGRSTFKALG